MPQVLRNKTAKEVVDLTERLEALVLKAKLEEGLCVLFVTHTTGCVDDGKGIEQDLLQVVEKMISRTQFQHAYDPAHAWSHMASSNSRSLAGSPLGSMAKMLYMSITVIIIRRHRS